MPRNRGGQPGNQNARKHGFYSKVLTEAAAQDFHEAEECDGLDEEIALLRLRIRDLVAMQPDNIELQMQAINALAKLLKVRYQLSAEQKSTLKEAILKVLTDVALPLGIKFIPGAHN